MPEINPVIPGLGVQPVPRSALGGKSVGGLGSLTFKELVKDFLSQTNQAQLNADQMIAKSLTGEINDVHTVMIAVTKAETSLRLLLEIRNRLISAYNEILRMRL